MDQPKDCNQIDYSSMETRNERFIPGNQIYFQDPSTTVGATIRPPKANLSAGMKPVLNYSITGEEFALEFMRERVNSWQNFIPNSSVGPGTAVGYIDLRGIVGNSYTGFEGGSAISMVPSVDLNHTKELEQKHSFSNEERVSYQAAPLSQSLSKNDTNRKVRGYASWETSDRSSTRIKFLCSFAGKVLPRPSDGKLRYVGGETRIIQINKNILWQELVQKALSIYKETRTIKYQLPGEDLDALVSVSCDEDLQNMMEECSSIEDDGSHKPRMFLFSTSDLDNNQFGLVNLEGDSEIYFVIAVNGVNLAPPKNAVGSKSDEENALDELFSLKVDEGPLKNFPRCSEANSVNSQPIMILEQLDGKGTFPPSVPLQANDFLGGGARRDKIPLSSIMKPADQLSLSEKQLHGECHLQELEVSEKEAMSRSECYGQRVSGAEHIQSVEKEAPVLEERSYRENLRSRNSETERVQPFDNDFGAASHSSVDSTPKQIPLQELHSSDSKVGGRVPSVHTRAQNPAQVSESTEVVTEGTIHNSHEQDVSLKAGEFQTNHVDAAHLLEPPVLPQRIFRSEWIPREQADSNRLSKSNDSFGTQFVMSQLQPELRPPITESTDDLCDESIITKVEHPVSAVESLSLKPRNLDDGMAKVGFFKERVDDASMMNSVKDAERPDTKCLEAELKCEIPTSDHEKEKLKCKDSETAFVSVPALTNMTSKKNLLHFEIECPQDKGTGFSNRNQIGGQRQTLSVLQTLSSTGNKTTEVTSEDSSVGVGASAQGDILIDINDRFPRDFLAEIFSVAKISQGLPGFSPLGADGTGMSLNMENHEPSHWSYFRNLVRDDFVRKDVSPVDDNHLVSSSPFAVNGDASVDYGYLSSKPNGFSQCKSHLGFDMVNHKDPSGFNGANDLTKHSDLDTSVVEGNDSLQFDAVSNKHAEESKYEIIKNEDLEELQELGSGTFGAVYLGKWRGTDVAIKRIKKSCFLGRSSEQERLTVEFWREAAILSNLHHPNVVALYGVVKDGPCSTLATVTEYMANGSLRHALLSEDKQLDYRKRLIIAMDAAFGMEYLHSKNIIHFDLKCDNLLVNLRDPVRPICKVGDFGLSKIKRNTLVTGGLRGTLPWMAPELLNGGSTKVSEKVDVFSFGIVLWEILTGEEPYANMHYGAIIGGIVNNTLRPPVPNSCDPEWRTLMEQCWAPDTIARPSFTEIARRLRVMSAAAQSKLPLNLLAK